MDQVGHDAVTPLDAAREYVRRGWCVVPIPYKQKRPVIKEWEQLRLREADLTEYFNQPANLGLILGNTIFSLPYVVVTIMAVLRNYDERLDHAAWTLGATRGVAFRRITLPLLKAGMVTAFLFAFVKAMDELAIALFVADAGTPLLPKQLWQEMSYKIDPSLAAVSTLILVIVGLSIATVQILNNLNARKAIDNDV